MKENEDVKLVTAKKRPSQTNIGSKLFRSIGITDIPSLTSTRHFNSQEVSKLYAEFKSISKRRKTLNEEMFKDALGILGLLNDSVMMSRFFSLFNKSKTGEITFPEYLEGLGVLMKGTSEEKLDFAFAMTDIDGSGEITLDEIITSVESMNTIFSRAMGNVNADETLPKHRRERMKKVFQKIDADQDGVITLDEYKQGILGNAEFASLLSGPDLYMSKEKVELEKLKKTLKFYKRISNALELGVKRLVFMSEQMQGDKDLKRTDSEITSSEVGEQPNMGSLDTVYHSVDGGSAEEKDIDQENLAAQMVDFQHSLKELQDVLGRMASDDFPSAIDLTTNPTLKKLRPYIKTSRKVIRQSRPVLSPTASVSQSNAELSDFLYTSDNEYTEAEKTSDIERTISNNTEVEKSFVEPETKNGTQEVPAGKEKKPKKHLFGEKKAKVGKEVYFGHKNWNLVLNVMKGIQMAVGRCVVEPYRPLSMFDFSVKEKYTLIGQKQKKRVRKTGSGNGLKSVRFIDYAPFVFNKLRESFGIKNEEYINSIGLGNVLSNIFLGSWSSLQEQGSEGKSGSLFYVTSDGKFLIKTVHREEHKVFRSILPEYYQHMTQKPGNMKQQTNISEGNIPRTLLTWILGCHVIRTTKSSKFRAEKIYLVVMNNILNTTRHLDYRFDLKGSTTGRKNSEAIRKEHKKTLKDLDFLDMDFKISVTNRQREQLVATLTRDSLFLEKLGLIDYSTLIGIHKVTEETRGEAIEKISGAACIPSSDGQEVYYIGLLDFLTPYGKRKVCERVFKTMQHWDFDGISVQPPHRYAKRFRHFMSDIITAQTLETGQQVT
eukprot:maker-scaffold_2-snap-gene-18.7-mRNA-1 protein AED:0.00 eAED:0.00 QI:13/1/1/1/1/1/2/326/828